MAAIAPDFTRRRLLALLTLGIPALARQPRDVRATLVYVGSALASGNPSDALSMFAKTCSGYDTLVDYFSALTTGYEVASEVEITDETPGPNVDDVEATWSLTLTSRADQTNRRQSENVKIRLQATKPANLKTGKDPDWKIVAFSPIELFNPQHAAK